MMDEYIYIQLEKIKSSNEALKKELLELNEQEADENRKYQDLLDQEDVGIEFFSPREMRKDLKKQLSEIKDRIEQLKIQQAQLRDQIEVNTVREEHFHSLIEESDQRQSGADNEQAHEYDLFTRKDIEPIYEQIKVISAFADTDKAQFRMKLKKLEYYVRALLS